ncbi:addiction module antitoxin RelB [Phragmitibacter flavus]|uniref:Addiction module antitoxin RelB n=1 Tax=Phragmitibacter flavus TaxID=2576071 RepID=A0A5R8KHX8_9BACT|nr:addiction module antitoxin RelB [Phragmitibacter flavus]
MIDAAEVKHMSVGERLEAMELLWDSLVPSVNEAGSPAWHGGSSSSEAC